MKDTLRIEGGGLHPSNKYRRRNFSSSMGAKRGRKLKRDIMRVYEEEDWKREKRWKRAEGIKEQIQELELYRWKTSRPPHYIFNLKDNLYMTCLNDYRRLFKYSYLYLESELNIPWRYLRDVCKHKQSLRIDDMIKLCYFLMIPDVEHAYNVYNTPPTYYMGNRYIAPRILDRDRLQWQTYAVGTVHVEIINKYGHLPALIKKNKVFVQKFNISKEEQRFLESLKLVSRQHIWRLIHDKRVPRADLCFRIVLALNEKFKENYKINDFWRYEEMVVGR